MGEDSYTAFWKGYRISKENEKSKRDAERAAMNKQQLIDKAIDDLKGKWVGLDKHDTLGCADGIYFSFDGRSAPLKSICTRQEFEARKAEREAEKSRMGNFMYGNALSGFSQKVTEAAEIAEKEHARVIYKPLDFSIDSWYDYQNQKALRLPPVGEVVLVSMNGLYCKAKVLEVTKNDCEYLIVCRVISPIDSGIGELKYFSTAKPLDWDKNKNNEVHKLAELVHSTCVSGDPLAIAKAVLAAGYRKCHNKTPSDKE